MKKVIISVLIGVTMFFSFNCTAFAERVVFVTRTGECFHTAYCRSLRNSRYAVSLDEAYSAGYRACRICRPVR